MKTFDVRVEFTLFLLLLGIFLTITKSLGLSAMRMNDAARNRLQEKELLGIYTDCGSSPVGECHTQGFGSWLEGFLCYILLADPCSNIDFSLWQIHTRLLIDLALKCRLCLPVLQVGVLIKNWGREESSKRMKLLTLICLQSPEIDESFCSNGSC